MRIGFIGLATPIAYDYRTPASITKADQKSSPNPILDSPWGIMLMFDEIWFLTRSLCPENLRNSKFVKFIDESDLMNQINISDHKSFQEVKEHQNKFDQTLAQFSIFDQTVKTRGVNWDAGADNHTHALKIGNEILSGNWANYNNIYIDQMVLKRLRELSGKYIEYIPNTFTYHWFSKESMISEKILTNEIIKIEFPNFLHRKGPYHPVVDEIREISELAAFRKYILPKAESISIEDAQISARKVRTELQDAMTQSYLNEHEKYGKYDSGLMFAFKQAAKYMNSALSSVFEINDTIKEAKKIRKFSNLRWQPFIIKTDKLLKEAPKKSFRANG